MGLTQTKVPLPPPAAEWYPGVAFMPATNERVCVWGGKLEDEAAALRPGTVILRIDGKVCP